MHAVRDAEDLVDLVAAAQVGGEAEQAGAVEVLLPEGLLVLRQLRHLHHPLRHLPTQNRSEPQATDHDIICAKVERTSSTLQPSREWASPRTAGPGLMPVLLRKLLARGDM